jgi:hypothetical protein
MTGLSKLSNLHLFEKILYCLMDEAMTLEDMKQLPYIVSLPFIEIIRYCSLF